MTQLEQKFSDLSKLAKSLDDQALDFSKQVKQFAEDLKKKLNSRRKKYDIAVEIVEMFDFSRYQIDFFISTKDSDSIYYVFTIDLDEDLDEEQILKECDRLYDEIYWK